MTSDPVNDDGNISVIVRALRELKACRNCGGRHCWQRHNQGYCITEIDGEHGEIYVRRGNCAEYLPLTREQIVNEWPQFNVDGGRIVAGKRHGQRAQAHEGT